MSWILNKENENWGYHLYSKTDDEMNKTFSLESKDMTPRNLGNSDSKEIICNMVYRDEEYN